MKKLLVLILAIMYIGTSSGIVLTTHLCMGKKPVKCACSKKSTDCCKDEVKVVKLESAHKASVVDNTIIAPVAIITETPSYTFSSAIAVASIDEPVANAPPGLASNSLFIRYCVFRI